MGSCSSKRRDTTGDRRIGEVGERGITVAGGADLGAGGGGRFWTSTPTPPALPARFAIMSVWPASFEVRVEVGAKDGTHPQFTVTVVKNGHVDPHEGVTARFGAFRDLDIRLAALNNGTPAAYNFPPTFAKQKWGFTLSAKEERSRAEGLTTWLHAVLSNEIEATAAKECVRFLKISDDRINRI